MNKKFTLILFTFLLCLAGYFICRQAENNLVFQKEIVYQNNNASEVYIVWGINSMQTPPQQFLPDGSYIKDGLVHTRMNNINGSFKKTISLPYNTILNYWMHQTKDYQGHVTDLWDSGGTDKEYSSLNFSTNTLFKPGYFIFLAGFLPLLLLLYFNKDKPFHQHASVYKINNYVPQFDSLRAIAVILVIIHHWFESNKVLNFFPNGPLGVNMFFVLSGFLITGILLKTKKQLEAKETTKVRTFKNFYMRRTLRIFPVYYLFLIVLWLIHDSAIARDGIYYFTYTANYLFFSQQMFPARVAHLWSLAVEEQFYLIWPWLIILINRKWLPYVIGLFMIVGISSNYVFINAGWWVQIFTPACFDAFAIGGFLSFVVAYRHDIIQKIEPWFRYIFIAVISLFLFQVFDYSLLPARTIHSLLTVCIIYYCLFKNNNKIFNYILDNKWLKIMGKVSYGVYLYHLFIPELWMWINKQFNNRGIDLLWNKAMPQEIEPLWFFIQKFSVLMLLCLISWTFIEKPINKLKRHFQH